jgi:nucleotide-binding universal stress UspA family protein
MYRTIVVALDGSEGSDRALPVSAEYAKRDGARVVVAHARTHALETAIETKLHDQVDELQVAGIDSSLTIKNGMHGSEADVIARIAADAAADLIVTASRGRGPFTGAVLGSVTQHLLPIAPCPVLVVPGSYASAAAGTKPETAAQA